MLNNFLKIFIIFPLVTLKIIKKMQCYNDKREKSVIKPILIWRLISYRSIAELIPEKLYCISTYFYSILKT